LGNTAATCARAAAGSRAGAAGDSRARRRPDAAPGCAPCRAVVAAADWRGRGGGAGDERARIGVEGDEAACSVRVGGLRRWEDEADLAPSWLAGQAVAWEAGPVLIAVESDEVGAAAVDLLEEGHASFELDELIEVVFVEAHAKVNEVDLGYNESDERVLSFHKRHVSHQTWALYSMHCCLS
jgi:hypothetical protein